MRGRCFEIPAKRPHVVSRIRIGHMDHVLFTPGDRLAHLAPVLAESWVSVSVGYQSPPGGSGCGALDLGPVHLSLIGIVGRSARLNQKNSNMSAHTESNHRRILTIDETAELLNVSTTLLQRWALADFRPTVYIVDNGFQYGRDEVIEWRQELEARSVHASWLSNTGHRWQPR